MQGPAIINSADDVEKKMKKIQETVVKKDGIIPIPYEGLFWPLMQLDKSISGTRNTFRRRAGNGEATLRDARRPPVQGIALYT